MQPVHFSGTILSIFVMCVSEKSDAGDVPAFNRSASKSAGRPAADAGKKAIYQTADTLASQPPERNAQTDRLDADAI
jgi:hypothetical protein